MFSPFPGLFFDPSRVAGPEAVSCPPYDVISEGERLRLLGASPHNVVRLLLPEDGDGANYQAAGRLLEAWIDEGTLVEDEQHAFHLYTLEYETNGGDRKLASGVLGALALDEDRVVPHEETMQRFEEDRLAVLRATRANLDPIVALSPAEELGDLLHPESAPRLDFRAGSMRHRLYSMSDPHRVARLKKAVGGHRVAIADGHHRFATALRYRLERGEQEGGGPWDSILAFVTPASDGGLAIGPVHRRLERVHLPDPSDLTDVFLVEDCEAAPPSHPAELVLIPGAAWRSPPIRLVPRLEALSGLPAPWRRAGSAVARELLYPRIGVDENIAGYSTDAREALTDLPPRGAAVLLAAIPRSAITAAIDQGIRFPQKSTFFRPKPWAGLVLRSLR